MTGLATTAPTPSYSENLGFIDIPFRARAKRLHLFGGNEADSIRDRLGGAPLSVVTGAGGISYGSNYVDHGAASRFITSAAATPRDTTIIYVAVPTFIEQVYDGDNQYRWPPTVSNAAQMRAATMSGYALEWNAGTQFYGQVGGNMGYRPEAGIDLGEGAYSRQSRAIGYKDATFTRPPQCVVLGYGPSAPGNAYFHFQCQSGFAELRNATAYPNAARAASATSIGSTRTDATAASHNISMAYLEYSFLAEDEARIARAALCGIVEARGFKNFSHTPQDMRL